MRQDNVIAIPAQAVAATINSAAIPSLNLFACSVQAVATGGSVAGTVKIQASNDVPVASSAVPTDWNDIPSATVSVTGAGAFLIPKLDLCYQYIRIVYTDSGTGGTIAVRVKALGD
jgi:hypothetical protein